MCAIFCRYKFRIILPGLIALSSSLFSQRTVEVRYDQDAKGAYVFSCINHAYCNYILELEFSSFTNLKSDLSLPFHAEVKPGYSKLFSISAIDPTKPVLFQFTSQQQKGCIHPDINRDFTYLLPISPGKDAQVYEMSSDKSPDSSSWYVLRLKMKPGDTIYAARKGIVNDVQDQNTANDLGQSSIGAENYIEVTQADCSFAHYAILKKNGSLVKPGQMVSAGQPIGIVGGDSYGRGSDLKFSVYYFQEDAGSLNSTRILHYIVTQIWTKGNGKTKIKHGAVYTSEFPVSILNQESIKPKAQSPRPKALKPKSKA